MRSVWWMLWLLPCAVMATPEARGPYAVGTWDAGQVMLDGTSIHLHAFFPSNAPAVPMPVVGVVHGASRFAFNMGEMSNTLASHGFVVVAPDMPCSLVLGCDHAANARQLQAMLRWGVTQSQGNSPISGMVDGTRRGLAGHSFGGLGSFLAAQGDPSINTVVILDANDAMMVGYNAAPHVMQPTAHLMADVAGSCNDANWKDTVYPRSLAPHLRVVVQGAAHCDVEDPSDAVCPLACGRGDAALSSYFRRYTLAWLSCVLQADVSMASWLEGADFQADVAAAHLKHVDAAGLDSLPCRASVMPPADAGTLPTGDAGNAADSGTAEAPDAGATNASSSTGGGGGSPGRGCNSVDTPAGIPLLAGLAGWAVMLTRRRR